MIMLDTKLLFLDIDGTLINSAKEISPRTKAAVQHVRKQHGVEIVLISARMPKSLEYLCTILDIPVNIVAFNGSIAKLAMLDHEVIELPAHRLLSHDLVTACHEAAKDYDDTSINIYTAERWLTNNTDRWTQREMFNTLVKADATDLHSHNIGTYLDGLHVHKVLLRSGPETVDDIAAKLTAQALHTQANTTNTRSKLIELTPHGVDKGKAIAQLSDRTGIPLTQMMAFGDADNDIEMLQTVKYGFAMADCSPELQSVAYEVVGSNNEEGVAAKLEAVFGF